MTLNMLNLPPPLLVDSPADLALMCGRLMAAPAVALDTESNSLYAYTERVCLLQCSIPGQDYLVDTLALADLPLGELFAHPGIVKVFHAAEYDVMVLRRDYGFDFVNVFDTMIASRIVGWPQYGLGVLLEKHFGVITDKRMQRTDWGKRPLSSDQLCYAQLDTHFLLPLRDMLWAEIQAQHRAEEARAAFERVATSCWNGKGFDPDGFWQVKGAYDLDERSLSVLRALYAYRDQCARALDRPPFKVWNDDVLLQLSQQPPQSWSELDHIKGFPRHLPNRYRSQLIDIVRRAVNEPPPPRPPYNHRRPDHDIENRYESLRQWRKQHCASRGVEPDVIMSNHALRQLAQHNPTSMAQLDTISTLGEWERKTYGPEIVAVLRQLDRHPHDEPERGDG